MHVYLYQSMGMDSAVASRYSMLEAHKGAYTGPGRVYNYCQRRL